MLTRLLQFASEGLVNCPGGISAPNCQTALPNVAATKDTLTPLLQVFFGVVGILTVIYIVISAIRYSTTLGDPQATAKLRNTIIWASVGLAVTLSAEVIVTFVLGRI